MPDALPVEVKQLRRRFGRRLALDGVSLTVAPGSIVGLVGPNGSGKTTLLRILGGLLRAHGGQVRVLGLDPARERTAMMRRVRFAFAPPALFDSLTAREHLQLVAPLGGLTVTAEAVTEVLSRVGLTDRADDRVGAYSLGMRQRLLLALALVPPPELLILDEPTEGLDPLAVRDLRQTLRGLGIPVLLSSHLLDELDELVDELLVLVEGRVLFAGPPSKWRAGRDCQVLEVDDVAQARHLLEAAGVVVHRCRPTALELDPGALSLGRAHELLARGGVELVAFHAHRPSLQDLVMEHLERQQASTA